MIKFDMDSSYKSKSQKKDNHRSEGIYFLVVDAFYEADLSPVMHINVYSRVYTRSAE